MLKQIKKIVGYKSKSSWANEDIRALPTKSKKGLICGLEDLCCPC